MDPVLVFRHGDDIPLGLLGEALDVAAVPVVEVMLNHGDPIPPLYGFSGLVVLGGVMGAYDEAVHPWLKAEKQVIGEAHSAGLPMLGICLGCQLFADALGGVAYRSESAPEIGHLLPELTAEAAADPMLRHFDQPVVVFHQDSWDLPPGSTLLAATDRFAHAFRMDSTVAIQAHPEADAAIVSKWVDMEAERPLLEAAGVDPEDLVAEVGDGEPAQREMAARLFGAWAEEVVAGSQ